MTLYVVATPIGHLDDITLRALRVLREVSIVLAEDTRRTKKLCAHHGITTPLKAFHAHSPDARVEALLARLAAGEELALVSDAGTPIVSDPGARLVAGARARGIAVVAVPGASAPIAALSVAGLPAHPFRFLGFLPRSGGRRRDALAAVAADRGASILFESPRRLAATLGELSKHVGDRPIAVCRELTKRHEEVARGTATELAERFAEGALGEITIVVAADETEPEPPDDEEIAAWVRARLADGERTKAIARALSGWAGLASKDAYARVLALRAEDEDA